MVVTIDAIDYEAEVKSIVDIIIEPRKSVFYYENCMLRVDSMLYATIYCQVMQ